MVVNDLGSSVDGEGDDAGPAAAVADEIVAAGGAAIPDTHDVSDSAGARGLVETAIAHFDRLDIVINNAGIIRWAGLPEADEDNLRRHVDVHLAGSFHTSRAAWQHLVQQGYGRLVMTTSAGVFGVPKNLSYAAAKGGVIGLTRSLATAGVAHGIAVNAIAPAAMTRMAGSRAGADDAPEMAPELVAPMAAYLAHDSCRVTGEIYAAGGGRFARIFIASTDGYVAAGMHPTIEEVAANWDTINDENRYVVPADLPAWSAAFLSHLE